VGEGWAEDWSDFDVGVQVSGRETRGFNVNKIAVFCYSHWHSGYNVYHHCIPPTKLQEMVSQGVLCSMSFTLY
jgi:hypothetical protein